MVFISACALARFYYGGNLHFNLELEPVLNRIKLTDTLTRFPDPHQAGQAQKEQHRSRCSEARG